MATEEYIAGSSLLFGTWGSFPHKDQYLGLRFEINGETHFGWARLSVEFRSGSSSEERTWVLHLSGYAYETIAGQGIHAGQTQGDDANASPEPVRPSGEISNTLGKLALGAYGTAALRQAGFENLAKTEDR